MTYKIGVIGDKESVLTFKLFGFTVRFANDEQAVTAAFKEMIRDNYGVIYITEQCAQLIQDRINHYNAQVTPAIVLIPNHDGTLGIGKSAIQANVEKAVGQNIL
ncbi:MAG: V-type ATP synthase subunit F [Enterococcus sp.]